MGWIDYQFEAIGTRWHVSFAYPDERDWFALRQKIDARIGEFDLTYSRFRAESLVTKIAQNQGDFLLPADAKELLDLYNNLYLLTNGNFTPLIGQALVQAGYDADYSLQPKALTLVPSWESALEYQFPHLRVNIPVVLDFGAAGKGYLVDLVSQILVEDGCESFCVDAGGDMYYRHATDEKIRIGLEHPLNTEQVIGVAEICNQSICGSAGNRRAWGQYHHIIDAHNLASPQNILATWVIAQKTIIADALATCLFFVSPEKLAENYDFEYLIMYKDCSITRSSAFPAEIFTS